MSESFEHTVVTTNRHTIIDPPAMEAAIRRCEQAIEHLQSAALACNASADHAYNAVAAFPEFSFSLERTPHVKAALIQAQEDVSAFKEAIGRTLLIFYGAERKASEFFALRARLYPTGMNKYNAYMEAAHADSVTALLLYLVGLKEKPTYAWRELSWPSFLYDGRHSILGFILFAQDGSDYGDALAGQIYAERLSQDFTWLFTSHPHTSALSQSQETPRFYRLSGGSWWTGQSNANQNASSVMAAVFFGLGRRLHGRTQGVELLGNVALDNQPLGPRRAFQATPGATTQVLLTSLSRVMSYLGYEGQFLTVPPLKWTHATANQRDSHPQRTNRHNTGTPHATTHFTPGQVLAQPHYGVRTVPTPVNPSATIHRISNLASSQDYGQIEILQHTTEGSDGTRHRSWSVIIRGTQKWDGGGTNPQDMLTNFQGVAQVDSDQARIIRLAMKEAGIKPDEPVEFVGHSQGGIIAAQLAADSQLSHDYTIASVLTAGSPTSHYAPTSAAGMLNLENIHDLVPSLDGNVNSDTGNNVTVYFDGHALKLSDSDGTHRFAHDISVYEEAMSRLESSDHPHASVTREWVNRRNQVLGLTDDTTTVSYVFDTSRVGEDLKR